jgi:UDP-sulfoquinovose synthase
MKVMVLGGDGFCGWPTALKLVNRGHNVMIVDNFSRRGIDMELNSNSLTRIADINSRIDSANMLIGPIDYRFIDIAEQYDEFKMLVQQWQPDTIVHFAEQRAAPYSMISQKERRYTVDNNINVTHNVLNAIVDVDPNIHLVHLGTMGVYGYSKDFGDIPEGYLNVKVNSTEKDVDILYPTNPGSVYHMTKSMDQLLFQFYNKNWKLKITDLHQGIVWGTETEETKMDPDLVNRFDYDGIYGTVLNRFISQAAADVPLTIYGTGGQKRAFIHIEDTANCVSLAAENPPTNTDKVRIFNQVSEVRTVKELAEIISKQYGGSIAYHENPRKELPANDLAVSNEGLRSLGFEPILLNVSLIDDVKFIAEKLKSNLNKSNVMTSPKW